MSDVRSKQAAVDAFVRGGRSHSTKLPKRGDDGKFQRRTLGKAADEAKRGRDGKFKPARSKARSGLQIQHP